MEMVKKLETTLAKWYEQLPFHLPAGGRNWLRNNIWWIVLIGVIASVISVFVSIRAYMWAEDLSRQYRDAALYYGITPSTNSAMDMTALWIGVVFYVAVIILEAMAINPLKLRQKKGWNLLFMAVLVSAVSAVVTAVVSMSPASLIGSAIGLAIGGYFLFEIHDGYSAARASKSGGSADDTPKAEK